MYMDKDSECVTTQSMNLDSRIHDDIYKILIDGFSAAELRNYNSQMKAFMHPEYFISYSASKLSDGFVLWWNFSNFIFVEYIWVALNKRRGGIGTKLLEKLKQYNKLIILEVEDTAVCKNIGFYYGAGFVLNEISYTAKALSSIPALKYHLLSSNHPLSESEYQLFINKINEAEYQF